MGTWGTTLYANDSTCDVRDTYIGFLEDQLSGQEAYEKTLEKCHEYIGDQDEPLFWFALAESQWRVGRLLPEVRRKALEWIEKDGCMELWVDSGDNGSRWKKTLENLKIKLESPMKPEKRFPKLDHNPWQLNDVYAYQFNKEESKEKRLFGKYMLIQKIAEVPHGPKAKIHMQIQLIDHIFDELPELDDVNKYRILPTDNLRAILRPLVMNTVVGGIYRTTDYPKKHLTHIGNTQGPANKLNRTATCLLWRGIEYGLSEFYLIWQDREYETIGEGAFKYTRPE